jgi:hypothetical protein
MRRLVTGLQYYATVCLPPVKSLFERRLFHTGSSRLWWTVKTILRVGTVTERLVR